MSKKFLALALAVAIAALVGMWWLSGPAPDDNAPVTSPMHSGADTAPPLSPEQVVVPELSPVALSGKKVFEKSCAACHGINAAGTDRGPPLIHSLYRPGHHGDDAFYMAATRGVIAHHWRFGNMPPVQEQISEAQMRWLVKYIREMQVANGVR